MLRYRIDTFFSEEEEADESMKTGLDPLIHFACLAFAFAKSAVAFTQPPALLESHRLLLSTRSSTVLK